MPTNIERYKKDMETLADLGEKMLLDLNGRHQVQTSKVKPEHAKAYDQIEIGDRPEWHLLKYK